MSINAQYGSLPFDEAVKYLRDKINLPTKRWTDVMRAAHDRAFVVAGAAKADLLNDLHAMINEAIKGNIELAEFRAGFDKAVKKYGWNYKGERGWRTATIFNTNMSVAYSAGRAQQRKEPEIVREFPYSRYRALDYGNRRPLHQSWKNLLLPWNHPWWKTHRAPNGWGCKCWDEPVSQAEYDRLVADGAKTTPPDDGTYAWENPSTGKTERIPKGIDPGWDYDPGDSLMGSPAGDK